VLVLRQNDPAAIAIDDLARPGEARETVFAAGGAAGSLPWIGEVIRPAIQLPRYPAIGPGGRAPSRIRPRIRRI
jgi:hypothetical protein